jgi:hypothetical protein
VTYLRRLGAFLYDFLVGDAWELFVGPIVVLLIGWALVQADLPAAMIGVALFLGVLVVAAINLLAGLRASA